MPVNPGDTVQDQSNTLDRNQTWFHLPLMINSSLSLQPQPALPLCVASESKVWFEKNLGFDGTSSCSFHKDGVSSSLTQEGPFPSHKGQFFQASVLSSVKQKTSETSPVIFLHSQQLQPNLYQNREVQGGQIYNGLSFISSDLLNKTTTQI